MKKTDIGKQILILYYKSTNEEDDDRYHKINTGFIREEVVLASSLEEALDMANPYDNEILLNTVYC